MINLKSLTFKSCSIVIFSFLSLIARPQGKAFLFSYFTGNGEDGLHLAYSTDGLKWQPLNNGKSYLVPTIGKDKLMRDPCIRQDKSGVFQLVWTSGWWDKGIGYASSPDLMNWSEEKEIPVMQREPQAKNCWAPEICYDPKHKDYLIFWATTIPGRFPDPASSEREKGLNHRIYYVNTKDFKTFSPTKLFFNPAFNVIDATIIRKDKFFYLIVKNENSKPAEKNIRTTKSKHAAGPYPVEVSAPITGKYWAEGPSALQVGDYVYVYFDKYTEHKYGAVRSKDMIHWEDVSDQVSFPEGTRHGSAFEVSQNVLDKLISQVNPN